MNTVNSPLSEQVKETGAKTLSSLATTNPGASRVFHRRGLDYCCGGKRTLATACQEQDVPLEEVVADLIQEQASAPAAESWEERPLVDLIEFILTRYHATLRTELPDLIALAEKVENKHGDKEACPQGLAKHLTHVHRAVLDHLAKEEQVLFPLIESGQGNFAAHPVRAMEQEHDEHAVNLRRIRELAGNFDVPAEACTSWKALYLRLEQLEADLMEHIHLENNVLFPRALYE